MIFLATLAIGVLASCALREPLKRWPWAFYLLAVCAVVLFLGRETIPLPEFIDKPFFSLMHKCLIAQALFTVVMFIGVFDERSRVRAWLAPVRAELSIVACILALGHIVSYISSFGLRILSSAAGYSFTVLSSFYLSLFLCALLLALGVTSFAAVKRRMSTRIWKNLQRTAYAFFLLTWVHILLYLAPAALGGGQAAIEGLVAYSLVFIVYCIARLAKNRRRST